MPRYKAEKIPYDKQDQLMDKFCEILSNLESKNAIRDFLKDLLNRQERMILIRRLLIAEMLEQGVTYREIIKKLKCGSPTIARVERWLHFGRKGYKQALEKKSKK